MDRVVLVSVVMPVYNAERYLREAIESILAQTFIDFEFLLLDDGSTDGSLDIARSYKDARIQVLAQSHGGLEAIRNRGVAAARGDYVAWIDADDICDPERLMKQVAYMDANPTTVALGTWARLIDSEGRATGTVLRPPTGGRQLLAALCAYNPFVNGSSMVRKDAVLAIGAYHAGLAPVEDYDLWLRLAEVGALANIPEPLYQLRVHPNSTSARTGLRTVDRLANRARRNALQRYLCRKGVSAPAKPDGWPTSQEATPWRTRGMEALTYADWAQAYIRRGQMLMGNYLLARALMEPQGVPIPSIIRQCYMSKETVRGLMEVAYAGMYSPVKVRMASAVNARR